MGLDEPKKIVHSAEVQRSPVICATGHGAKHSAHPIWEKQSLYPDPVNLLPARINRLLRISVACATRSSFEITSRTGEGNKRVIDGVVDQKGNVEWQLS